MPEPILLVARFMTPRGATKLHTDPADLWFVGDSLDCDVGGALNTGMTAIWYDPTHSGQQGPQPHATIRHWDEFHQLMEKRT